MTPLPPSLPQPHYVFSQNVLDSAITQETSEMFGIPERLRRRDCGTDRVTKTLGDSKVEGDGLTEAGARLE